MFSYAYQSLLYKNYESIETETFETAQDLFASLLAQEISSILKKGLYRHYVDNQENLSNLRGKIDIKESIKLKLKNNHKLACNFDELSENNYMNMILKTTALFLINDKSVKQKNKDLLKKSIFFFSSIDKLEITQINWRRITYNRNNISYKIMMEICYLILHELLLTTEEGSKKLKTFFDEEQISRLFEKFILAYYRRNFNQFNPVSKEIKWNTIEENSLLPKMKSDVMLSDTKNNRKLILDAKFYGKIVQSQFDKETIRSNHLYQIFSYVKNEDKNNTGLVDGILLYAKTDENIIPDEAYNFGGNRIFVKALDLNNDFSNIKNQLNSIVYNWQK